MFKFLDNDNTRYLLKKFSETELLLLYRKYQQLTKQNSHIALVTLNDAIEGDMEHSKNGVKLNINTFIDYYADCFDNTISCL